MGTYVTAWLIIFFLSYTLDLLCGFNFFSTIFSWVKRKVYTETIQRREREKIEKIQKLLSREKVLRLVQNNSYDLDFLINYIQNEKIFLNEFELSYLDVLLPYSSNEVREIQQQPKEINNGF